MTLRSRLLAAVALVIGVAAGISTACTTSATTYTYNVRLRHVRRLAAVPAPSHVDFERVLTDPRCASQNAATGIPEAAF
jgi:hypothetical protein